MKESVYKSYDELPLFINSETLAKVLGISPSSCYELMHEDPGDLHRKTHGGGEIKIHRVGGVAHRRS